MNKYGQFLIKSSFAFAIILLVTPTYVVNAQSEADVQSIDVKEIELVLERVYVDGERSVERIVIKNAPQKEIRSKYKEWDFVWGSENEVGFRVHVHAVSPLYKINGDVDPFERNNELESERPFFQYNTKRLKSNHIYSEKKYVVRTYKK